MNDEVRDRRPKGWSWFDNTIIDHFGPLMGAYAIAVYMALVRHSDAQTQQCYPSQEALSKELKISESTIKRAVATLMKFGLVRRDTRRLSSGNFVTNIYTLTDTWGGVDLTSPEVYRNSGRSSIGPTGDDEESLEKTEGLKTPEVYRNSGDKSPEVYRTSRRRSVRPPNKTQLEQDSQITPQSLSSFASEKVPTEKGIPPISPKGMDSPAENPSTEHPWPSVSAFISWYNEKLVPLGAKAFDLDNLSPKLQTRIAAVLKAKRSPEYWAKVEHGVRDSAFLRGKVQPDAGRKRFSTTLPWLLSVHKYLNIENYTLITQGQWRDDAEQSRSWMDQFAEGEPDAS